MAVANKLVIGIGVPRWPHRLFGALLAEHLPGVVLLMFRSTVEAIRIAHRRLPAVILVDMQSHEDDDIELLLSDEVTGGIPIIAVVEAATNAPSTTDGHVSRVTVTLGNLMPLIDEVRRVLGSEGVTR